MLHIGFITYGLDRPLTGISRYTYEYARTIANFQDDVKVTLLSAGGIGNLETEVTAGRLGHLPLRGARLLPSLLTLGALEIRMAAARLKLDIVHDPTGTTPFLFGTSGVARIVTLYDVIPWSFPQHSSRLDQWIYKNWLPKQLPTVNQIITISEQSQTDIVSYMPVSDEDVQIVPLAAQEVFKPILAADVQVFLANEFEITFPYLLYVGNLTKRKNLERCLKAFAKVHEMFPEYRFVLVGPSTFQKTPIASIVDTLGITEKVILLGTVSDDELAYLYNGAEIFVFPSLYEGFGLPILEAMACGTAVIASLSSSMPEIVGESGILVDPENTSEIVDALRILLSDATLRREYAMKGLARSKQYTWEATVRQTIEIYHSVAKDKTTL